MKQIRYFATLGMAFVFLACAPVKFFSSKKDPGATPCTGDACPQDCQATATCPPPDPLDDDQTGDPAIACGPKLNDSQTQVTYTVGLAKPKVSANCSPSAVTYSWTVKKGGTPISVPGLNGEISYPDFTSQGDGTYEITLNATATDYQPFNSPAPLQVILNYGNTGLPSITCSPKVNGSLTSITLPSGSANPVFTGNCDPTDVSYVWTTLDSSGQTVTIPGLSGGTATANFSGFPSGTYEVYLSATKDNYNPYQLSTPIRVTIPQQNTRTVTYSKTVGQDDNQVDILLVLDDSNSMGPDNQHIATRLQGFVNELSSSGLDWQMCLTLTHAMKVTADPKALYWGASTMWEGVTTSPRWLLKKGQSNVYSVFVNTINRVGAETAFNDERAIKAAYSHAYNGDPSATGSSGCYRKDAALALIILSDEDERSIGGDCSQKTYPDECQPMEKEDMPANYIKQIKDIFGAGKRLTANSIIVRPGDTACKIKQDMGSAKSHYGVKYAELSELTSGYVGNICEKDYSTNLNYFKDHIATSLASIPLECTPVGSVDIDVEPAIDNLTTRIENQKLIFTPKVTAGRTINLRYQCAN
mgnify:CR=1 FL=1